MNVYKLAIFVIALNFILGSANTLANISSNDNQFDELTRIADQQMDNKGDFESQLKNDDSKSSVTDYASSIGSNIKWTGILKSIFMDSLNPLSLNTINFDSILGKVLVYLLSVFRIIVGLFLVIKTIMIIKNKDTQ